jgi:hypothetical protein
VVSAAAAARCPRRAHRDDGRHVAGANDELGARLLAPERSAVQRAGDRQGILQRVRAARRWGTWLVVTTVVDDPVYLTTQLILSTQFKKESSRAKWNPRPCEVPAPLVARKPTVPGPFD